MFYDQEANKMRVKYGRLTMQGRLVGRHKRETEWGGRLISRGRMDQ